MPQGRAKVGQGRPSARLTRDIREELVRGLAPLDSGSSRVDRSQPGLIIIRGVKVVGKSSPNRHRIPDVEGTDYLESALEKSLGLYANLKVNVNHPPRSEPNAERQSEDRLGKITNPYVFEGETYGNLAMLASHPMAERLANAAEAMPDAFALSHNARGIGEVRNGRYVITEIPEVRSVDVVADGGTCVSLFESREAMKKKLSAWVKESKHIAKKARAKLLEAEGYAPDMMDAEAPEAPAEGGEDDWKNDIVACLGKLVQSEDGEKHDLAAKLLKLMQPESPEKPAETPESDESDDDDGDDTDEGPVKESLQRTRKELASLKSDLAIRDLCESLSFAPSPLQRTAIAAVSEKDRKALIAEFKTSKTSAPRSGSPGTVVTESRKDGWTAPKDSAERVSRLLRN